MASCKELRGIAKARLKSAKILMNVNDWHGAAYMLAYALECSLKAVTCKTLNLVSYPENTKKKNIDSVFMTHSFQQLLLISGLENIFSSRGPAEAWDNWGKFTIEYPANWPQIRYNTDLVWDEEKVEKLYDYLLESRFGIISIIRKRRKW